MQSDVQQVKERLNIVDVVGEYVRLNKAGTYFKARCPFHEEKTPSFVVNEDRQTYHCFGCEAGGDVISFVMEMENLTFREALTLLASRAGIELTKYTPQQQQAEDTKKRLYDLMAHAQAFYEKQLWSSNSAVQTREYLANRGLSTDVLKKFHIGFAPDGWDHIETFLVHKGYTTKELVQAGMSIAKDAGGQYDRFRHRIMFPIADTLGRTIGFSARVAPGDDETQAKYINTPETPLYHKSDVLYGIHLAKTAIKKADSVIIVEGNVDVIAAHEAGIENVVAVSGTALTAEHIKILKRYTTQFILFFDADTAGQKAARRSAATCFAADVQLSLVSLDGGKDAADIVAEDPEKLRSAVGNATDALTFFIREAQEHYDITQPHQKRQALERVLALAAEIAHPVERDAWVRRVSEVFDTTHKATEEIMQQFLQQHQAPPRTQPTQRAQKQTQKQNSPPSEYERVMWEIFMTACAFPEAWKVLTQEAKNYPFVQTQPLLEKLVENGEALAYDLGAFIEKYPAYEKLYSKTAHFRDQCEQTHEKAYDPQQAMHSHLTRAQKLYHKKRLAQLTAQLQKADREGDSAKRDAYLKELNHLTKSS